MTSRTRKLLGNIGLHFFDKWKIKAVGFLLIISFGVLTYTALLPREGFPSIQFPLTLVNGTYFVDDAEKVDAGVVRPALEAIKKVDGISETQTSAQDNSFQLVVFFEENKNPETGKQQLEKVLSEASLPEQVKLNYLSIDPASYLNEYDLLLVVQDSTADNLGVKSLQSKAEEVAKIYRQDNRIDVAEAVSLIETAKNPLTEKVETRQTGFNFFAESAGDGILTFNKAVTIGVDGAENVDVIELSNAVTEIARRINDSGDFVGTSGQPDIEVAIGADFASSIKTQISSLESNLLTGIFAVAIISWLLITWRASIITGVFMLAVVFVTMIALWLLGYTLNTITLFALVLALGLFVDDSTIITEAIVANRKKKGSLRNAIASAIQKVAPASIAGTLTTVLVFLPLAFVSGILGEFIRVMPITVVISLVVSLVLSLTLIPILARIGLNSFNSKPSKKIKIEEAVAAKIAGLPTLLKRKTWVGRAVGLHMFALSILFLVGAGFFAQKVEFNIFPPSDDSDQISVSYEYASNTSILQAELIAEKANKVIADELGDNAVRALYGGFTLSNQRDADVIVELKPFTERGPTSVELARQLQSRLSQLVGSDAKIKVRQLDNGPPSEDFPFKVQVLSEVKEEATRLAKEIQIFLSNLELTRASGEVARITDTQLSNEQSISRKDGKRFSQVSAAFSDSDVSALVELAQKRVETEFNGDKLMSYSQAELGFDFGQESDSAESFAALGVIFPLAIGAILLLLAVQFRSLLQPILIILAIPFSLFGVFLGLYVTDNAFSFFSNIGLIGLVGIAVNNTILLTDYANQERRLGKDKVTAISNALKLRLRPLVATTLTTVVALLPLALNDPFWEPLAYTIIFGLVSSTTLVILSFPYYYITAETMRDAAKRLLGKLKSRFGQGFRAGH